MEKKMETTIMGYIEFTVFFLVFFWFKHISESMIQQSTASFPRRFQRPEVGGRKRMK